MKFLNKIDRFFLFFFFIFSLFIGGLLAWGDQTYPRVVQTSLTAEVLPLSTNQVVLTFSRNMNQASVEKNLKFDPPLAGKFSWIGKKMAYSFIEPVQPGQTLRLQLANAFDSQGVIMEEAYQADYRTASQYLYFIGSREAQKERLVRYDLTQQKTEILSPQPLIVSDFKVHPNQQLIYLFAMQQGSTQQSEDLYQLNLQTQALQKIVDGKQEFVFAFDLSPNGNILLVRKGNFNQFDESALVDPGALWVFDTEAQTWSEFWNKEIYGNEFFFSPDSNYLVGRLITGDITILPVEANPEKSVYLSNYKGSYNLSPDGTKLVFVDFEDPFAAQDLLLRGVDGETQTLLKEKGQIQFPVFNRKGDQIYFLMSIEEGLFQETGTVTPNPYHLYRYDLVKNELIPLTDDEAFFEGFFNVSSDGQRIAFERYHTSPTGAFFEAELDKETPEADLWIFDQTKNEARDLKLKGVRPYLN